MATNVNTCTRKAPKVFAIVAMILLLIYLADAGVGKGKAGFLPLSASERGGLIGAPSIIFFVASFIGSFQESSKITTSLLIAGGALMSSSVLVASAMSKDGIMGISTSFLLVVIIGFIIMSMGLFHILRKKHILKQNKNE